MFVGMAIASQQNEWKGKGGRSAMKIGGRWQEKGGKKEGRKGSKKGIQCIEPLFFAQMANWQLASDLGKGSGQFWLED